MLARAMEPNTLDQARPTDGSKAGADAKAAPHSRGASSGRFSGEDGHSLTDMAQRDLDAALQLLADRAQYITGAAGAAIALRRSGKSDMLCRASAGSSAPELGVLFSSELGLSGESVRTRQPLRCDDAQRDTRVNGGVCRRMGIASVMVMPVVQDDEVLGVFELFSDKVSAFGERDLSALRRLSEMVGTAVRLARAAEEVPERLQEASREDAEILNVSEAVANPSVEPAEEPVLELETEPAVELPGAATAFPAAMPSQAAAQPAAMAVALAPTKPPLFWSAAANTSGEAQKPAEADQSHVPPVLRNLRKCEACGFPVSAGRVLCVECEEKKWRGQFKR
jgi:GAF domain-containing protein